MNKLTILLCVLLLASVVGVGVYNKRTRSAAKARPVVKVGRTVKGVMPPLESTAPGVRLAGSLRQSGEYEYADIVIHNDGDQPIDAFELSALVSASGTTTTNLSVAQDARWPQFPGDQFKLTPATPLIPPHGDKQVSLGLGSVADDSRLSLTAVALHDGRVMGRNAAGFQRDRAVDADKAGHHDELRALDVKLEEKIGTLGKS